LGSAELPSSPAVFSRLAPCARHLSGFSASIQRFPDDKLAVIILTNTDEQIATTLAKKIAAFYW